MSAIKERLIEIEDAAFEALIKPIPDFEKLDQNLKTDIQISFSEWLYEQDTLLDMYDKCLTEQEVMNMK